MLRLVAAGVVRGADGLQLVSPCACVRSGVYRPIGRCLGSVRPTTPARAEGKTLMSAPISASMTLAVRRANR
jgi:hypothetical protein